LVVVGAEAGLADAVEEEGGGEGGAELAGGADDGRAGEGGAGGFEEAEFGAAGVAAIACEDGADVLGVEGSAEVVGPE
jgi:hypothetical protein